MRTLLRMREPLAWLVVAVTVAYIVLGWLRLGWNLARESMSLSASARQTGASVPLIWIIIDVSMILSCLFIGGMVRRARVLTRLGAVVVSVAALYDVFILVVGVLGADASIFSRILETIGGLLEVAAKLAAAVVLWRLTPARMLPDRRSSSGSSQVSPTPDPVQSGEKATGSDEASAGTDPGPTENPGQDQGEVSEKTETDTKAL